MLTSSHLVCCWFQIHDLRRFFLFIIISTVTACVTDFRTDTVTSCDLQVLEIRPGIAWDKGQAVNFLLESLGMANPNDVLPVYIGDDRTDEDAFKLLNGMKHGCSILVSTVPKSTNAAYSIRNPSEVKQFLHQLVQWRMNKNPSASSRSGSMTTSMSNPTLKYKRTP
jgi:hypothetical protein